MQYEAVAQFTTAMKTNITAVILSVIAMVIELLIARQGPLVIVCGRNE